MTDFIVKASTASKFISASQTEEELLVLELARKAVKIYHERSLHQVEEFFICDSTGMMLVDEAKFWYTNITPNGKIKSQEYKITIGCYGLYFSHDPLASQLVDVVYKGVKLKIMLTVCLKAFDTPDLSPYEGDYIYLHDGVPFLTPSLLQSFYFKELPFKPVIAKAAEIWVKEMRKYNRPLTEVERTAVKKHQSYVNELKRNLKFINEALQQEEYGIPPLPELPRETAESMAEWADNTQTLKLVKRDAYRLTPAGTLRELFNDLTGFTPEMLMSHFSSELGHIDPRFINELLESAKEQKTNIATPTTWGKFNINLDSIHPQNDTPTSN